MQIILLVSDINMPGMNGLDLLPMVKARRPDIPVFMISAYGDKDTITTALERGANKFLTKPVDFLQLKQDITAVIAGTQDAPRGGMPCHAQVPVPSVVGPLWVESGGRASLTIYCASVSQSVRCVSPIVSQRLGSVSRNLRRNRCSIARRAVQHCAPLHLLLGGGV